MLGGSSSWFHFIPYLKGSRSRISCRQLEQQTGLERRIGGYIPIDPCHAGLCLRHVGTLARHLHLDADLGRSQIGIRDRSALYRDRYASQLARAPARTILEIGKKQIAGDGFPVEQGSAF